MLTKCEKIRHFNLSALERDKWRSENRYYYAMLEKLLAILIPPDRKVIEIGCGTGELLASVAPAAGVGVDFSSDMVAIAQQKFPALQFRTDDAEDLQEQGTYDYIILSDLLGEVDDVWRSLHELHKLTDSASRLVITSCSHLWAPLLRAGQTLKLKTPQPHQNWLSLADISRLLSLNGFEVITSGHYLLLPVYIPLISHLMNRYIAVLPLMRKLSLVQYLVAREIHPPRDERRYSVSIIIPCRNEQGNVEETINRIPAMGSWVEIIFVDGESTDGTVEKLEELIRCHDNKNIRLIHQTGHRGCNTPAQTPPNRMLSLGKGDAVRKGFEAATGDILMILDADLTVPPEDLPKFYDAIATGRGEFINGTRLVYPMEKQAMRTLNLIANKLFSLIFTWLLGQPIKDTLCGTKVLFRRDYEKIRELRGTFGELDPFGDFDLLFGAARQNLKIVEVPVRYCRRTYGEVKIERFRHGLKLLRMSLIGLKKFKLF
jgi:glycosyltransferase involved in cell wall biosynthesis/2-polyprenyl-3-methyl-5-hydroxy-6-metoxy-1,4-benzoquinol methylase